MTDMFSIDITKEAEEELHKLEQKTVEVILKKLWSIRQQPLHFLERLTGFTLWKLRVGDYRVIVQLSTKEQKITVVKVGHRKDVYVHL